MVAGQDHILTMKLQTLIWEWLPPPLSLRNVSGIKIFDQLFIQPCNLVCNLN